MCDEEVIVGNREFDVVGEGERMIRSYGDKFFCVECFLYFISPINLVIFYISFQYGMYEHTTN